MMDTLETFFFWETITSLALLTAIVIGIGLSGKLILDTVKSNEGERGIFAALKAKMPQ